MTLVRSWSLFNALHIGFNMGLMFRMTRAKPRAPRPIGFFFYLKKKIVDMETTLDIKNALSGMTKLLCLAGISVGLSDLCRDMSRQEPAD